MARKTVSNKLVVGSVLIILCGLAVALDVTGVVKWLYRLSDKPVIGLLIPGELEEEEEEEETISPMELENGELRGEIVVLQKELVQLLAENNKLQVEIADLQEALTSLAIYKEKQDTHQVLVDDLVMIYQEMKPAVAAAIFTKLGDDLVVEIFSKMPSEQVTRILSQMETDLAGRLTTKMVN